MKPSDTERIAADLAKIMALICVRNTRLEDLRAGAVPVTLTGDYSDVFVVDAEGRKLPWADVAHIDDTQMADLMRDIVNRLYTFHVRQDDLAFRDDLERWMTVAAKWGAPALDHAFLEAVAKLRPAR